MAGRKDRENSDQDQRIKHADFDLFKLQEKLTEVTKLADLRDFDLKRTNEALSATQIDLHRARDENNKQNTDLSSQTKALDTKFSEKNDLTRRSEAENGRNRSMTSTFYDFESKLRATDENLNLARREQQDLQLTNSVISGNNRDLTAEIDALQLHCTTLTSQNRNLTNELQVFVQ